MPSKPSVSIIIISYNTREMTLECLRSLVAETTVNYELIVLDNASEDGSAEAIGAEFPEAILLAETSNHGFAKGNNIAIERATSDYILLLNPDTLVLDHAVDHLLSFAHGHPEARIWGGRTLFADHSLNLASCWARMTLWSLFCQSTGLSKALRNSTLFNPEAMGGWLRDSERNVDIVSGCFFLIGRRDWQQLGGFDKVFFMYGEEADLCLRAQAQLGARPRITPTASIVHYGGASEKVKADKMVRLLSAKTELAKRHFPKWQRPLAKGFLALWALSRATGLTLLRARSEQAHSWRNVWHRRREWRKGFSN